MKKKYIIMALAVVLLVYLANSNPGKENIRIGQQNNL